MTVFYVDLYAALPAAILQMLYMIEGSLRAAFVEENGGGGAVVNDLSKGDVTFIPQGLVHYQQNLECEPAAFLASFNSEDAGSVDLFTLVFDLPAEVIQVSHCPLHMIGYLTTAEFVFGDHVLREHQ